MSEEPGEAVPTAPSMNARAKIRRPLNPGADVSRPLLVAALAVLERMLRGSGAR